MSREGLKEISGKFESLKQHSLHEAVKYLTSTSTIAASIRECVVSQTQPAKFSPLLFQWLYSCAQLRSESSDLYTFVLQFTPDVILVYLHAVYESVPQLKANSEALLLALVLEAAKEKPPSVQVPSLFKPSIYHQLKSATKSDLSASHEHLLDPLTSWTPAVQLSPVSLTEAALQRHDQSESPPPRPTFTGKEITVNNRLLFLSTLIEVFNDRMMLYPAQSHAAFCKACIRLSLQGMGNFCGHTESMDQYSEEGCTINMDKLGTMRRYSVNDALITSLLQGIRMCLFQSCHSVAMQALQALKMRAEYELLTCAIQVSHALVRLSQDVKPTELQLDPRQFFTYTGEGRPAQCVNSASVHTTLNSQILHHKVLEHTGGHPSLPTIPIESMEQSPCVQSQRKGIIKSTAV